MNEMGEFDKINSLDSFSHFLVKLHELKFFFALVRCQLELSYRETWKPSTVARTSLSSSLWDADYAGIELVKLQRWVRRPLKFELVPIIFLSCCCNHCDENVFHPCNRQCRWRESQLNKKVLCFHMHTIAQKSQKATKENVHNFHTTSTSCMRPWQWDERENVIATTQQQRRWLRVRAYEEEEYQKEVLKFCAKSFWNSRTNWWRNEIASWMSRAESEIRYAFDFWLLFIYSRDGICTIIHSDSSDEWGSGMCGVKNCVKFELIKHFSLWLTENWYICWVFPPLLPYSEMLVDCYFMICSRFFEFQGSNFSFLWAPVFRKQATKFF